MPYGYRGTIAPLGQGLVGGINSGLRLADYKYQRGRQEKADQRAESTHQLQLEDRKRTHGRQDVQDARAAELHGARMENMAMQQHINQFNFADLRDEKNRGRLSHAMSFMEDYYDMIEGKDDIDGPKFIDSMNGLFDELIGEGKQVTGIYGDDEDRGIMLELGVDDGKGGEREAPMTMDRSEDPEDPVVVLPWNMLFQTVESLDSKLKDAGYDMSTKESRTKAFDALQSLTGNTGRKEKRLELDLKRQGKAPSLSSDERMIRDVMANWTYSDGSKPTYQEAFQIVKTGAKPQTNREAEIRHWTKFYQEQYQSRQFGMRHDDRKAARQKWEQEHPDDKFSVAKWARDQATKTLDEIIAQAPEDQGGAGAAPPEAMQLKRRRITRLLAPPEAIEFLKQNPDLAPQFKQKYGYLPDGFDQPQPPAGVQGSSPVLQLRQPQPSSAEAADHQQESGGGAP